MLSIQEINILKSQNNRLKQQNKDLQKDNNNLVRKLNELKSQCKAEKLRNKKSNDNVLQIEGSTTMTDKEQIIIDEMNVIVQQCIFWQEGHCDCYQCENRYPHCLDYPNCYFKQLARKTQECEKWKSYYKLYRLDEELLKKIQAVVNSHPKYGVELTDTGVIEKDERLCTLEVHEQIKLIFDETLKENEELKKQVVRCSEGWGKADCEKNWYQQAEQAKQEENHDLTMKLYSYRMALEEIEEILDNGTANININAAHLVHQHYLARFCDIRNIISNAKAITT